MNSIQGFKFELWRIDGSTLRNKHHLHSSIVLFERVYDFPHILGEKTENKSDEILTLSSISSVYVPANGVTQPHFQKQCSATPYYSTFPFSFRFTTGRFSAIMTTSLGPPVRIGARKKPRKSRIGRKLVEYFKQGRQAFARDGWRRSFHLEFSALSLFSLDLRLAKLCTRR